MIALSITLLGEVAMTSGRPVAEVIAGAHLRPISHKRGHQHEKADSSLSLRATLPAKKVNVY